MTGVDVFLSHHGVKGMKWGVRNDDPPSGEKRGYLTNKNAHSRLLESPP